MKCNSSDFSSDFVEGARNDFHCTSSEESRPEHLAQLLQVLERQRRIAEKLAAFEREMQAREAWAAQAADETVV